MTRAHILVLGALGASVAGCVDLLGVETLTGIDAGDATTPLDAAAEASACELAWVDASSGDVPPSAVPNEIGDTGVALYVCRVATPTLGLVPGKLLPGWACYFGDGVSEQSSQSYQVLVPSGCALGWGAAPNGIAPIDALVCGSDADGGALYSCRVGQGAPDPGELGHIGWSTDHACVYSTGGSSLATGTFDVLTSD